MTTEIRVPRTEREWEGYYGLRYAVLRAPFGAPPGSERDEHENGAVHRAAFDETGAVVAVGRLHATPDGEQVRYMAVLEPWRGKGVGAQILQALESESRSGKIFLNARERAVPFYERHGYRVVGPAPAVVGVPHFRMEKIIHKDEE
jgi:GNAT superfamily N-acetyltransferase